MDQDLNNECVNELRSLFDGAESSSDGGGDHKEGPAMVEEVYVRKPSSNNALSPPSLRLSLVSARHSLWGHRLWNAALLLAEMFDNGDIPVEGRTVLELGAGAGLPGLICAMKGARKVVISDYATSTDRSLMVPIGINIDRIQPEFVPSGTLHAVGHVWGQPVAELLEPLVTRTGKLSCRPSVDSKHLLEPYVGGADEELRQGDNRRNDPLNDRGTVEVGNRGLTQGGDPSQATRRSGSGGELDQGFDVVIMADLLFNRSQHAQLLESCDRCLGTSETATVWVSFSHHDPQKAELDLNFFALARMKGFLATRYKTAQMRDLFVEDDGMDHLRGEVHLYSLTRDKSQEQR